MSDVVERLRAGLSSGPNTVRTPWGNTVEEAAAEIERLRAEVARLGNCHRIITMQVGYYKPELPDFTQVDIYLGVLRAAARCVAGLAPWESADHQQNVAEEKQ